MNRKLAYAVVTMTLAGFALPAFADGALNAELGVRPLKNEAYWNDLDTPTGIGISGDIALGPVLPLWINVRGQFLSDGQDDTIASSDTLDIAELTLGLKLMQQSGVIRPYMGAGILRDWVSLDRGNSVEDSDATGGWYVDGGAMFWFARHFNIGLNLRWVKDTKLKLFGAPTDVDGRAYGLVVGYTWGTAVPARHHERRRED